MPVVPPVVTMLAEYNSVNKCDLSSLDTVYCGGGVLKPGTVDKVKDKTGIIIRPEYGMTECGGPVAFARTDSWKYGTIGPLCPHIEAKVCGQLFYIASILNKVSCY